MATFARVDLAFLFTSKTGFMQAAQAQGYKPTYLESDFLSYGATRDEALLALGRMMLADVKHVLDQLIREFQSRANIGIIPRGALLHLVQGRQRNGGVQVFGQFEVVVEVRENQHG